MPLREFPTLKSSNLSLLCFRRRNCQHNDYVNIDHGESKSVIGYSVTNHNKLNHSTFSTQTTQPHILKLNWSYRSWIYNYLCNECLSPLTLWVRIPIRRVILDTTLCELRKVGGFSPGTPVSSTNKTDRHDIAEILLKVVWNTINHISYMQLNQVFMISTWDRTHLLGRNKMP
jgi:hypothetical protein